MDNKGVKYQNAKVWVSLQWLSQYYARPSQEVKRSGWKTDREGYVCYQSVIESIKRRRNQTKLDEMPKYEALLSSCKSKAVVKSKIGNKNAEKNQQWHKAILNTLYANAMPIYNPTHVHRLYVNIVNETINKLMAGNKIKKEASNYIAIQDIINSTTGELIISKGEKVYEPISLRSVERYLQTKRVQALYDGERLGGNHAYQTYTPTAKIGAKNLIWCMDGYTNNFYVNNSFKTTVTYVIIDPSDGEILAVATGLVENNDLQMQAWKQAIEYTKFFPKEVEVDGNNILEFINDADVRIKHALRRKKNGYFIEGWFAQMQNNVWRKKLGYRGDNILAKKKGARKNTDIDILKSEQYPNISIEQIHNEWLVEMEKSRQNRADLPNAGTPAQPYQIARLFGKRSHATISKGFVLIEKTHYEVPAELHLHEKMPNDWRVETAVYNNECYIYNKGLFIAALKQTKKPSRSSFEKENNIELVGHHANRDKRLKEVIKATAEAAKLAIPDEAESIIDAANSRDYWTKITEKQLDTALSESINEQNQKRKKMFSADDDFFEKPLEIIKTA